MKIGVIMSTLVMMATIGGAQVAPPAQGPRHFRWSERTAHELEYSHTIRKARDLTPGEKKVLLDAVVFQLKRGRRSKVSLGFLSDSELQQLAADTRIELTDLNNDGTPEIIAQANGLGPCGGTGNCLVWVFQFSSGGVKLLLDSITGGGGFEELIIRPWSTNGFRDIVLGSHESAMDRELVWFKYGKGTYRPFACYHLSWLDWNLKRMSGLKPPYTPEISPLRCSEELGETETHHGPPN